MALTLGLRNSRGILERELFRLAEFAQVFNKLYATKNNKWFNSAEIMLKKIQSHYMRWRDVLKLISPKKSRKKKNRIVEHSIYETSLLNKNQPFERDFFGIASYGSMVANLKAELEKFISDLVTGIKLCQTMLNEEKQIKENPEWIKEIYEDSYNLTVAKNRDTIDWLVSIGRTRGQRSRVSSNDGGRNLDFLMRFRPRSFYFSYYPTFIWAILAYQLQGLIADGVVHQLLCLLHTERDVHATVTVGLDLVSVHVSTQALPKVYPRCWQGVGILKQAV